MSQAIHFLIDDIEICREMPNEDDFVIEGVPWGRPWALFTPAYWLSQLWMSGSYQQALPRHRARGTLYEEIVFCMLGGNGITAELASAAFESCRSSGLIDILETSEARWAHLLQQPLQFNGRVQRYRFPNQKARFIAGAMAFVREHPLETAGGRELRDNLLEIRGIGPKTAGWIARNYLGTDEVAILDIHLVRAGLLCGLFTPSERVERDYFEMETRFVSFCHALNVRPAILDCLIWDQMRAAGGLVLRMLNNRFKNGTSDC